MSDERESWLPAEAGSHAWDTVRSERTVLAIARTMTSAIRLLDVLEVFRGDWRVRILFTINDTSAFSNEVPELLRALAARAVPWDQIGEVGYDLAVVASENADLDEVPGAPVVVVPHGVGFHKYVPDSAGKGTRLSGVVRRELLRDRQILHVVSHPDQEAQLLSVCPEAAGRIVMGGDPSYDLLLASLRLRDRYRDKLGVTAGSRLVVLSSTWGKESLLGRWPELAAKLVAELPADEYRVALVVHPNVRSRHGSWQLEHYLADALDAGLMLVPSVSGWHAALVAADCVIGDHGSVTWYGAALGRSLLLGAFGEEAVPDTAMTELGRLAERLDPQRGLREQVEKALNQNRFEHLASRTFAQPGESARLLRELFYGLLDLAQPRKAPRVLAVSDPQVELRVVRSFQVFVEVSANAVTIERYPANLVAATAGENQHLQAEVAERDRQLVESASVLVGAGEADLEAAKAWASTALEHYPGCRLAVTATADGWVAALRDGRFVLVGAVGAVRGAGLLGSAVYACLRAGRLHDGVIGMRVGSAESVVTLRLSAG